MLAHAILGDEYDDESEDDEHHDDELGNDDCVDKNSHILPTGQWYAPSAVNYSQLHCVHCSKTKLFFTISHHFPSSEDGSKM